MTNFATVAPTRKVSARKPTANAAALPPSKTVKAPAPIENEAPLVTIADIRNWIGMANEKLEKAYDAAERGEVVDMLLDHINHNILCAPWGIMQRADLTQADAKRVYQGLFPVLACLQGAIKFAEESVLYATLREAFDLLEAAQDALDPMNDAVRDLPEGGEAHDFERGRDLAIQMMKDIDPNSSSHEGYRCHREAGEAQRNFVMNAYIELLADDSLSKGFTSVLSSVIGGVIQDADYYQAMTLEETEAGAEQGQPAAQIDGQAFEALGFDDGPYLMASEAIAIIQARAPEVGCELFYGAKICVEKAKDLLGVGMTARDVSLCERASAPFGVAIAVMETALSAADDVAMHGALRLLDLAKKSLDDAIAGAM
ncbi:hypothetical protein WIX39_026325 [Variovorax sp. AB1(2024)]|uniref:hypothetical protein n=1 Tax=Variovorax sp. AB1(2024) TaxID=3132214 RepID=UPI0030A4EFEA